MKKYLLLLSLFGILTSCIKKDDLPDNCENDSIFRYDSQSGKCLNCKGEIGLNTFDLNQVKATKSAECMEFPAMHLVFILDTANIEDFHELGYNDIQEFNFKGADLNSTSLHFNQIINSSFEGASLSQMEFGYAIIRGNIDSFTEFPEGCTVENDSIYCIR